MREEVESSEKDRHCITKMMTALLLCRSSSEKMPDRE